MTKAEHIRLVTWRSKILQHAAAENRTVAQTCRYFGIARKTYTNGRIDIGPTEMQGSAIAPGGRTDRRARRRQRS